MNKCPKNVIIINGDWLSIQGDGKDGAKINLDCYSWQRIDLPHTIAIF
jgi:hypothetical protein